MHIRLLRAAPSLPFPKILAPAVLTVLLSACGGGSGGESPSLNGSQPEQPSPLDPLPDATDGNNPGDEAPGAPGAAQPEVEAPTSNEEEDNATDNADGSEAAGNGDTSADTSSVSAPTNADTESEGVSDTGSGDGNTIGELQGETDPSDATLAELSGPVRCDASTAAMQIRALELINAARAEARECGNLGSFDAVSPLGWDSRLEDAARVHSTDMATADVFSHTGTDGSSAGDRIERADFRWREYAENIAAGQPTIEEAVAGWIDSPGHCRNLMAPGVTTVAVACVVDDASTYQRYWTNVLADPLTARRRP